MDSDERFVERSAESKRRSMDLEKGCRVEGLRFRVWGLGLGFRVSGLGFRVSGLWFRVSGLGFSFRF